MKENRKQKITIAVVILVIAALCATPVIINKSRDIVIYKRALRRYENGQYDEAIDILSPYTGGDNDRCRALIYLCRAVKEYQSGEVGPAHSHLWYYNMFRRETKGVIDVNDEPFVQDLNEVYDELVRQRKAAEEAAYEEKIRSGVPFEGMSESRIDDTSLGKHADVRRNSEIRNNKRVFANIYVFKRSGRIIFEARCLEGEVTHVLDYRDGKSSSPYSKENRSAYKPPEKQDDDPYNVNDFVDPEDFYYENYADFFDYYDAEDYFNEHHE